MEEEVHEPQALPPLLPLASAVVADSTNSSTGSCSNSDDDDDVDGAPSSSHQPAALAGHADYKSIGSSGNCL